MIRSAPVPILLYHTVTEEPPSWLAPWNVSPATFGAHLDAVVEAGCTPLTVKALAAQLRTGEPLPPRPIAITFDDGFADFALAAAPAMHRRGIAGTLYATTGGLVGRGPSETVLPPAAMLAWTQLAELEGMGIEIGAHTHRHPQLDVVSLASARKEIEVSKAMLEEELGHPMISFAYPHGYSSARVRRFVAEAGYHSACAVGNALSRPGLDVYRLARLMVRADTPLSRIEEWVVGRGAPLARGHELARSRVWRGARRARALVRGVTTCAAHPHRPPEVHAGSGSGGAG
jgi:peptidoglycan/xylan/chitin deacetylase (PgdA/CDA1 family)